MAKLIITLNKAVVGEVELKQGETVIGRRAGCDLVLDDITVSGVHAMVHFNGANTIVTDLHSTNGTYINQQRVEKHTLSHGDVITIGQHNITYQTAAASRAKNGAKETRGLASVYFLSGELSGKRVDLADPITNLGKTEKPSGMIKRVSSGYLVAAAKEGEALKLNGKTVSLEGIILKRGDIIEVGDTRMQFVT